MSKIEKRYREQFWKKIEERLIELEIGYYKENDCNHFMFIRPSEQMYDNFDNFNGKTFVLTGTLETITRDEASLLIENAGGKVSSSVSAKTYAVIVGENPGSKYTKAKDLNIEIWTEEEFKKRLEN
mgnify:CR=1 FL=1